MPDHDAATTARQRHATDAGLTGDKAPGLDPAASPLGTDDEAAGTTPQAAITPTRTPSATQNSPSPEITPAGQPSENRALLIGIIAFAVLLAAGITFGLLSGP